MSSAPKSIKGVLLLARMVAMHDDVWQSQSVTNGKTKAHAWVSQSWCMYEYIKAHAFIVDELAWCVLLVGMVELTRD
jgi:hypothetical protein